LTTKPRMSPVVTSCAISSMACGSSGARNAKTRRFSGCVTTKGALPSRGTHSSSSAMRQYAIPAVVSVSSMW
jgi:hypothetical protein